MKPMRKPTGGSEGPMVRRVLLIEPAAHLWELETIALGSLERDPREAYNLNGTEGNIERQRLGGHLDVFVEKAMARRPLLGVQGEANLDDEVVRQRLRGLGYIE